MKKIQKSENVQNVDGVFPKQLDFFNEKADDQVIDFVIYKGSKKMQYKKIPSSLFSGKQYI